MIVFDCSTQGCGIWLLQGHPFREIRSLKLDVGEGVLTNMDLSPIGQKLNLNFFPQTFRAPPGHPCRNSGDPAQKFGLFGFPGFRELFGSHSLTWKTPTHHQKISGPKSLGLSQRYQQWKRLWVMVQDYTSGSNNPITEQMLAASVYNIRLRL